MLPSDRRAPWWWCSALATCVSIVGACTTKGSPTQPASQNAPGVALRGMVAEALSGAPIDGATVTFTSGTTTRTLTTSGGGVWEISDGSLTTSVTFEVAAPGFLTRRTHLSSVTRNGNVVVDLIRDASPFSLEFYRQLIRNQLDAPGSLPALKRWTRNPSFYVNTRNPRTGTDLSGAERDVVRSVIERVVPQMTGGALSAATVEFGPGVRTDNPGAVTLTFVDEPQTQHCGWSRVGTDPGAITLNLATHCETPCGLIAPRTLAHEVGHALGFYHVASGDILSSVWSPRNCASTTMSWIEQHHARLAYARQPGNRDADFDPISTLFAAQAEQPAVIACPRGN